LHNLGLLPPDEPRVKSEEDVLLRVYCHAYGSKVILLLAGYDKGEESARKREQQEIRLAQRRLKDFEERVARGTYES
jgi:hypothetical protein